ncbi:exodeoxyribonuclease VII large subunit [Nitratiruptor tergarcus]|uniref:Exodeoxyribonuclease 7 large subunit n=1 Tax=Nitratiruptor tergarcus DSM 16512 TaxID=1069081 RepID=A0A1W1WS26_9BACT|nr:exodeoxyribonuclease VII large subunit [Nitratiruptor tergarcus]SMC09104.1 Exodeoxyribonuclease VII large subunit [Nitratiruptor tergarcus DSM 16512]
MQVLTVSQLNEQIKSLLESHFLEVYVEGEVSRPTYHTSGHLYFSLKDEKSVIRCVMFRSDLRSVPFRVEEGQKLILKGRIGIYTPRGEYQLYAKELHPAGAGSLQIAFEQLKKKLEAKGYFAKQRPIPDFVKTIAIVTSATGAALQDMLRIIDKRWPLVKVYIVNSLVQGKEAAQDLAHSIEIADSLGADVMIVGRGGGSIEDLWCFNEEIVAEAIYKAKTPVVSAVGHEIDYVISDFVADLRAPTPSAAIERILPDKEEILLYLDTLMDRMHKRMQSIVGLKEQELRHIQQSMAQLSPHRRLELYRQQILNLSQGFSQALRISIQTKEQEIPRLLQALHNSLAMQLQAKTNELILLQQKMEMAYRAKELPKGSAQVVKNGKPVMLSDLKIGDEVQLQDLHYRVGVKVESKDVL